ncbi:MAG: hypothetical protein HZB86_07680 [Deltaproteobacteria bacterium]|nr:hypothetical protein [Deltaproteobacteria bacterium]
MEILAMEEFAVTFGVAFTTLLALVGVAAGVVLAGIAEEEKAGARLLWAEWPMDEKVRTVPRVELRIAA